MEDNNFFMVTVKLQAEKGVDKYGETKYKKFTETYIVEAGSPQIAANRVEKEMKDTTFEWEIQSVRRTKITKILQ